MLSVLLFIVGIAVILLLARYNNSNKLFWTLLLAMLAGFMGGTIATNVASSNNDSKHASLYQSMPTQGLTPQTIEALVPQFTDEQNILAYAKPVSQVYPESNASLAVVLPQHISISTREIHTGANPGIAMNLFDTS